MLAVIAGAVMAHPIKEYFYPTNGDIHVVTVGVSVTWVNGSLVTSFNWGTLENSTAYVMEPLIITNIENSNVTLLLATQGHSGSIIDLSLTWNCTSAILQPDESVIAQLEQNITATGPWGYTTVITAEAT